MKEVERTNVVIVNLQQKWIEFVLKYDSYTMDLDYKRNCYNYTGFKYIARHYRNLKMIG